MFGHDEVHVADGAEFVRIVSAAVVDDGETKLEIRTAVTRGPLFEMGYKLCVRYDVGVIDGVNGLDVVDYPLQHRLACDRQERLGLIKR